MTYCIDYRNGGMGNTLLTHVLYSCEQIQPNLANFFSTSGNAHKVGDYNNTQLEAAHLREFPVASFICIVELYSDGWYELLRQKMSYSKWINDEPSVANVHKFFTLTPVTDADVLWQNFYRNVKDPTWPECNSYNDVKYLPVDIQQEIYNTYQQPQTFKITNDAELMEFLSATYYDSWAKPVVSVYPDTLWYPLSDYFANNLELLKQKIASVLPHWRWNQDKSNQFHEQVLHINQRYFDWLSKIKTAVEHVIHMQEQSVDLAIWEKAMVVAKSCKYFGINPRTLHWNTTNCFLLQNNVTLINSLKRLKHGKTV